MTRSRYDELHDRFDPIPTTKAGTRYERLVAMVLKALQSQHGVIHDIKLAGTSKVKHQIDVTIERAGTPHRVLIECKDYDVTGRPVGLGVIRDFRSVVEEIQPQEAIVMTCNGFTRDARQYAKAKGIKLMVLRQFEPRDAQGRILKVVFNVQVKGVLDIAIDAFDMTQADLDRFRGELAARSIVGLRPTDPVYAGSGSERTQIHSWLSDVCEADLAAQGHGPGLIKAKIAVPGGFVQVDRNPPIPIQGLVVRYRHVDAVEEIEILPRRVAEMLLSGFGGDDLIIFDDQLRRHRIDADGRVL